MHLTISAALHRAAVKDDTNGDIARDTSEAEPRRQIGPSHSVKWTARRLQSCIGAASCRAERYPSSDGHADEPCWPLLRLPSSRAGPRASPLPAGGAAGSCNSVPLVLCCTEFPVFRDAGLCLSQTDLSVADQAVHPNLEGVLSLSAVFTFPRLEYEIR